MANITKEELKERVMELLSEWELIDTSMDWQDDALCKEYDGDWWFSTSKATIQKAQDVCSKCLVREKCLDYSMNNFLVYGIWGGKSASERRWLMGITDLRTVPAMRKRALDEKRAHRTTDR